MAHSFDFDEEPFDCRKRASSVGHMSRMNGMNSSMNSGMNSSMSMSKLDMTANVYPQQNPSRLPQTSKSQLRAPKSPFNKKTQMPDIPKSPRSASNKASSFRQRRLLLAQQRKWKDEMMEKTVQSKTMVEMDSDQKSTISGKEKLMDGVDGLEISISGHLEKEGFDHSLLPMTNYSGHRRHDHKEFPSQSANSVHDDGRSVGYGEDSDPELDAMTIDTVSSLNTMQSEFSRKSWLSQGLKSPRRSPRQRKKLNVTQNTFGQYDNIGLEDSLHPPMYVQSKVERKKSALKVNTSTATKKEEIRQIEHFSPIVELQSSSNEGPDMDELKKLTAQSLSVLEVTDVISNRTDAGLRTRSKTNQSAIGYEKENDIPAIESIAGKYERSSPIPQILTTGQDEMASIASEMSGTALRRRRLQNMYLSKKKNNDEMRGVSSVPTPNQRENQDKTSSTSPTRSETAEVTKKSKQTIDISFGSLKMSPFDESNDKPDVSFDEEQIDSDLHTLADMRDVEEDERSVITSKSVQTYSTLKTCLTQKPATREAMEAAIQMKQDRLKKIHHALTCTHPHPTKADDEFYVPCPEMKHCHALCILVKHVQTCTSTDPASGGECEVPGCAPYKKVWNHYRRCILRTFTKAQKKKCKICGDVWRNYAQDLEYSFDADSSFQTLATNEIEI